MIYAIAIATCALIARYLSKRYEFIAIYRRGLILEERNVLMAYAARLRMAFYALMICAIVAVLL